MIRSSSEERKGCIKFVQSLNLLAKKEPLKFPKIQLFLVGDSFIKEKLTNLKVKILFDGYVKQNTILADLYAAADIFVNSSLADLGPSMLAQAVMSGTPCITNNLGLAKDLVSANGIILKNLSADSLYRSISKMMDLSNDDLNRMRKFSRQKALELINEEKYLAITKNLIKEFVEN